MIESGSFILDRDLQDTRIRGKTNAYILFNIPTVAVLHGVCKRFIDHKSQQGFIDNRKALYSIDKVHDSTHD